MVCLAPTGVGQAITLRKRFLGIDTVVADAGKPGPAGDFRNTAGSVPTAVAPTT